MHYDADKDKYYVHAEEQYDLLSQLVASLRGFVYHAVNGLPIKLEKPLSSAHSLTSQVNRLPPPWQEFTDSKTKKTFYFNPITREATFLEPTEASTTSLSRTITTL